MAGGYRRDAVRPVTDTGRVTEGLVTDDRTATDDGRTPMGRRTAGLLIAAGLWPLLVWPNFVRVVATDERAFDGGPTAYLIVHVTLAVVSMALGVAVLVVGVRAWRRAR